MKKLNSWVLSTGIDNTPKYIHHYFCSCSEEFSQYTDFYEEYAPDTICPKCKNDYYKDVYEFENMTQTKIWKHFKWDKEEREDETSWNITLFYQVPTLNLETKEVVFSRKNLVGIQILKDGSNQANIKYLSNIVQKYSLFINENVEQFKNLLSLEIKKSLYIYIMQYRTEPIDWIDNSAIDQLSIDEKLQYITFFLKNKQLKEHQFFFWKMQGIDYLDKTYTSQTQMLNLISNHLPQKSVKKALFQGYLDSLEIEGYSAYSDYIFSRVIENTDLLVKLYELHPVIKGALFNKETLTVSIEFLSFLKDYYSEKQIVKLFAINIQDTKTYKHRLGEWSDTLRLVNEINDFGVIQEHFIKVKLTAKKLHDEIIRVSHLVSYILDAKEEFEYKDIYLNACTTYKGLSFNLPKTVQELSLWARTLHNCMLGYKTSIHTNNSVIYGVFENGELLYAIRLKGFQIVEAKASCNRLILEDVNDIVNEWKLNSF